MISSTQRRLIAFTFALAFLPGLALAQTPSPDAPFQGVQERLKVGQTAEVVDNRGLTIRGIVTELSPSTLVLTGGFGTQSFGAADVVAIKRAGRIWDGAIKGALIGLTPAILVGLDCSDCSSLLVTIGAVYAGVGAAIGVGIDALFGPKTVYRSAPQKRTVSVGPILRKDRQGFGAAIRF